MLSFGQVEIPKKPLITHRALRRNQPLPYGSARVSATVEKFLTILDAVSKRVIRWSAVFCLAEALVVKTFLGNCLWWGRRPIIQ